LITTFFKKYVTFLGDINLYKNCIMNYLFSIAAIVLFISCAEQNPDSKLKKASDYFPDKKTQVLVVGTFHFNYPGLDYNQTLEDDKIDVLSEPKKSEVTELVEYIKRFKPNKIAIEAFDNWDATTKLKSYIAGEHREKRDERYQLGMRIANELQLDTLYAIDSWGLSEYMAETDSLYINNLFKDFDFQNEDPFNQYMTEWYKEESILPSKTNLLRYFKHINSKEAHDYGYGAYLVGDFKLENYRGADILSIWWYNRNLRIFRNLQTITESENDRILVIFGNGHASVFRQLLEASPEYDFVEFDSL
jgi:hypothetical protein